jgi:putative nucleotidyltransferase with HDIG domain
MAPTIPSLDDIIAKTTDLPSLPIAVLRVAKESASPGATTARVAECLASDQALSARVLRLANSAYYGLPRQVKDLREAVMVLGMRCVRNLAIVASSYPWLSKSQNGYGLPPEVLWQHSVGVAVASQLVARNKAVHPDESAFTAGLLHDLGMTVMGVWLERGRADVVRLIQRDCVPLAEGEMSICGFDHTEVGARLAESWNLPPEIIEAIRYHHSPDDCDPRSELVDCVHVGDYLTYSLGFGLGAHIPYYFLSEGAMCRLGLTTSDVERISLQFVGAFSRYLEVFEVLRAA